MKLGARERKRHESVTLPVSERERALSKAAEAQARRLRREHRALYTADARRFRRIVRAAQSAVFRQQPAPKPDRQAARRIARAARRPARGAKWPELYERFLPGWKELNPVTRADAEDGFRRKVNKYRQRNQRMGKRGAAHLGSSCENARVKIEIIGPIENPDDDNVDVLLRLDDGRVYSFLVATPKNIYWCMQNESLDYWFGEPPVFVRTLTVEAIEKALRAIVNEDEGKWLHVYGTRQSAI